MKGEVRGLKFWENFTYRVKIEFFYPKTGKTDVCYVTKVDLNNKSFEFKSKTEVKNEEISKFKLTMAVELMNSMVLNGYNASIEPWF